MSIKIMKKLISSILILFSISSYAELPDIIAIVDDNPITKIDFLKRKNLAVKLNNIDIATPEIEKNLEQQIVNILIEEELLIQHDKKSGDSIGDKDIDMYINRLAEINNMDKNALYNDLKEKKVSIDSFRRQIKGEIIKHRIISSISSDIEILPSDLNTALFNSGDRNFDIEAILFTANNNDDKTIKSMKLLHKKVKNCDDIDEKLYSKFASKEKINTKLHQLSSKSQSVVSDTEVGSMSSLYQDGENFQMFFVCKKDPVVTNEDQNKLATILTQKKMSQKARKFFKDLRAKSYVKVMLD